MAIQDANGDITIGHATPVTLSYSGEDSSTGIEYFSFPDSSLNESHTLQKRAFDRKVSGATATRKGKLTVIQEKVDVDGVRSSMSQSVNLIAHSAFTQTELEGAIADLGQLLLDNKTDLAKGAFDS